MASRLARLWQPGTPQARAYLPNFWISVIETSEHGRCRLPPNCVKFEVDAKMGKHDIREYLEKVYGAPVRSVRTELPDCRLPCLTLPQNKIILVQMGAMTWNTKEDYQNKKALWKEEDNKYAYVFMEKGYNFCWPMMFTDNDEVGEIEKHKAQLKKSKENSEYANADRGAIAKTDMLGVEENKTKQKEESEEELNKASDSYSETSFMDLPDDIHLKIFAFLDLPSRLKLRLNKRLDQLQLSVTNKMNRITLHIEQRRSRLTIGNHIPLRSSTLIQREKGLRLLALNTFVDTICIIADVVPNEQQIRIIEALFHVNANKLIIKNTFDYNLSRLTLPSFLILAQNVRDVEIEYDCISLSAKDLCTIRKTMLEGDCTMKSFKMPLNDDMKKSFWEECFGVTISHCLGPVHGAMYQAADDSLQIYGKYYTYCSNLDLQHFEGGLHTLSDFMEISFKKLEVVEKPDNGLKIKWNHLYRDI